MNDPLGITLDEIKVQLADLFLEVGVLRRDRARLLKRNADLERTNKLLAEQLPSAAGETNGTTDSP